MLLFPSQNLRLIPLNIVRRHNSIITAVFGQASASLRTAVTLASERSMTGLTPDGFYCLLDRLSPVSKRINAIRSNPNDPLVCRALLAWDDSLTNSVCNRMLRQ